MAAIKGDSRENLLDAAEALFAEKGYEATTTREIASRSKDTLGTLSYHFGSKQKLLEAILDRRFPRVDELRWGYYREAMTAGEGKAPGLESIIKAIVLPYLDLAYSGDAGWDNYINILGRIRESGNEEQQTFFLNFAVPYARTCIGWLETAAPHVSVAEAAYCYEFTSMLAILSCSEIARNRMSQLAAPDRPNPEVHRRQLLAYALAGAEGCLSRS